MTIQNEKTVRRIWAVRELIALYSEIITISKEFGALGVLLPIGVIANGSVAFTVESLPSTEMVPVFLNRLLIVIFLETVIAFFFGALIARACTNKRHTVAPTYIIYCAISAWISFFNLYVFLYDSKVGSALEYAGFFACLTAACALAIYAMRYHVEDSIVGEQEDLRERGWWSLRFGQVTQALLFVLFSFIIFSSPD